MRVKNECGRSNGYKFTFIFDKPTDLNFYSSKGFLYDGFLSDTRKRLTSLFLHDEKAISFLVSRGPLFSGV